MTGFDKEAPLSKKLVYQIYLDENWLAIGMRNIVMQLESNMPYSAFADLNKAIIDADRRVPLGWVSSHSGAPYANFGDALSPVVIAALSGLPSVKRAFDRPTTRLISAGTIIQEQTCGRVHVWGSGCDPKRALASTSDLELIVHAVRGPRTRDALRRQGFECPMIYGDPGSLLPRIIEPSKSLEYELGVIVHLSELEALRVGASATSSWLRYLGGQYEGVKIISTLHEPTWNGFNDKVLEITSCRRIASTSFHGLIVPEAYGIPSIYFSPDGNNGLCTLDLNDNKLDADHRFIDFFLGKGKSILPAYARYRDSQTDWSDLMVSIDAVWDPLSKDEHDFLDAFPLDNNAFKRDSWSLSPETINTIIW